MIGIIYVGDIQVNPYIDKYIRLLEETNRNYEVIFWNRENKIVELPSNYMYFNKKSNYGKHPVFKIVDFFEFGVWVRKTISRKKYDKLIILSTLSGILIADTILGKYRKKYIFDIRDYSYENLKLFYKLEEKLIRNSSFTCISSHGFKEFLPNDYSYVIAHNFNYNDLPKCREFKKKEKGTPINVVWNGHVRYFEHQSKIIKKLKNDNRFKIIYHGTGPEMYLFENYCQENKVNNVEFTGAYINSDKPGLLAEADILNNSYGAKKENEVKYAIANKYYDSLIYGIPQLVEINTFKHKKVETSGVGIGLDVNDYDFSEKLYDYYLSINEEIFNKSCMKELNSILEEDEMYLNNIRNFITV